MRSEKPEYSSVLSGSIFTMNEYVAMVGKRAITEEVINIFENDFSMKCTAHEKEIKLESQPEFIFACCDYKCSEIECYKNFIFAWLNNKIPFIVLRILPIKENKYFSLTFSLSFFQEYNLTSSQLRIIEIMRSSKYYAANLKYKVHPSSSIYKIAGLQHAIAESSSQLFNLKNSAQAIGFSPCWLSRRFHEVSQMTLAKFVSRNNLCNALWRIINTERLIKEIAFSFGYTQGAFCRSFKGAFKMTPTILRKNLYELYAL
jgi:AraC-like DNA-binding protein